MTRANGPNLGTLMPGGMAGAVGVALPAGHLIDLADRLTKSDADG